MVDECVGLNELLPDNCVGVNDELIVEGIECVTKVDECVGLNEILPENCVGVNDELTVKGIECVLEVGKKFPSFDRDFQYYLEYARKVDFPIRQRNLRKGPYGFLRSVTFVCSREENRSSIAQNSLKPHLTMQIGFKAKMIALKQFVEQYERALRSKVEKSSKQM